MEYMTIPNQNNYPNVILGYGTGTIKQYGCTLACLSAVSGIEILKLHNMLKGTSFADSAFAGASRNLIYWLRLAQYTNGVIKHVWRGYGYDESAINKAITKHGFCLVEVQNGSMKHWIVALGNRKALDPLTGGEISTSKYPTWTGWSELEVKETMSETMMQIKKTDFENLVTKSVRYDNFVSAGYKIVEDVIAVTSRLNSDIERLSKQNARLTEELAQCQKTGGAVITREAEVNGIKGEITGFVIKTVGADASYKIIK
jgi:hypothetical protein